MQYRCRVRNPNTLSVRQVEYLRQEQGRGFVILAVQLHRSLFSWFFFLLLLLFFFYLALATLASLSLLILEVSWSHTGHTTVGRTPLDEGPARRRDFYLTTHTTHNRRTSMSPAGFEPAIPVDERPQTYALYRFFFLFSVLHLYYFFCPDCAFCSYCATHPTQTSMPPAGFEPVTPASDRPQSLALDRSATGISFVSWLAADIYLGAKWPERETVFSPTENAEVENLLRFSTTPSAQIG